MRAVFVGIGNFLLVQAGWIACVGGAARGWYALGPVVVTILVLAFLRVSDNRRRDLALLAIMAVGGTFIDSLQSALGLLSFRGAPAAWLCPLWITALWLHFATALRTSFAGLAGRPLLAAALGAVGGPLAYGAGERLGAATFHPHPIYSIVAIAIAWGIAFPLALRLAWPPDDTLGNTPGKDKTLLTSSGRVG